MSALARSNLFRSEVLTNDEHNSAGLRAAKRPRALNNPQGVVIEQQLSEIANSGGGGAMPAASAVQPAQSTGIVVRGHQWDKRPVYSEDASEILRLEEALIKGGWAPVGRSNMQALSLALTVGSSQNADRALLLGWTISR